MEKRLRMGWGFFSKPKLESLETTGSNYSIYDSSTGPATEAISPIGNSQLGPARPEPRPQSPHTSNDNDGNAPTRKEATNAGAVFNAWHRELSGRSSEPNMPRNYTSSTIVASKDKSPDANHVAPAASKGDDIDKLTKPLPAPPAPDGDLKNVSPHHPVAQAQASAKEKTGSRTKELTKQAPAVGGATNVPPDSAHLRGSLPGKGSQRRGTESHSNEPTKQLVTGDKTDEVNLSITDTKDKIERPSQPLKPPSSGRPLASQNHTDGSLSAPNPLPAVTNGQSGPLNPNSSASTDVQATNTEAVFNPTPGASSRDAPPSSTVASNHEHESLNIALTIEEESSNFVEKHNEPTNRFTATTDGLPNSSANGIDYEAERYSEPSNPLSQEAFLNKSLAPQTRDDEDEQLKRQKTALVHTSQEESKYSAGILRYVPFVGNKNKKNKMKGERGKKIDSEKLVEAKHVETDELEVEDLIIAVMGPTGSGKSTFINKATGIDAGIGHDLESCTSEIGIIKMTFPGYNIVFVDTPGFDDTKKSDSDILKMISDWLEITFKRKILLSGLLYFHRISDNRMAGTPLKNLRMFEELCGKNSFKNVILTTTMWDEVDQETGATREGELKNIYWKAMIDRGSSTGRFEGERDSAFRLIAPLLDEANNRNTLLLQKELVDLDLRLSETHAGQKLRLEIKQLAKQQQELLHQIREELKRPNNATSLQSLMEEYEELKKTSGSLLQQMADLQVPLGRQFKNTLTITFGIKRNRAKGAITAETKGAPPAKAKNVPPAKVNRDTLVEAFPAVGPTAAEANGAALVGATPTVHPTAAEAKDALPTEAI